MSDFIPLAGILAGIIIPLAVFLLLYHEEKGKRETVLEIAKHLDDAKKVQELLAIFEERKKESIDYRRGGVITLCVGSEMCIRDRYDRSWGVGGWLSLPKYKRGDHSSG